jgi:hypothetical protein
VNSPVTGGGGAIAGEQEKSEAKEPFGLWSKGYTVNKTCLDASKGRNEENGRERHLTFLGS